MDTISELRKFNRWRRGLDAWWHEDAQPNPQEVVRQIDAVCDELERLRGERSVLLGLEVGRQIDAVCDELERLRGERSVLLGLLASCAAVILTIEGENNDESDALNDLLGKIDRAIDPHKHGGALI